MARPKRDTPDRTSWSAFYEVIKRNELRTISILRSPEITDAPSRSERRKIGDFYAACTDGESVEGDGTAALLPTLSEIAGLRWRNSLIDVLATGDVRRQRRRVRIRPGTRSQKCDPRDREPLAGRLKSADARLLSLERAALESNPHCAPAPHPNDFMLLGTDGALADRSAAAVLAFETQLARFSKSPEELPDPLANFHPMSLAALDAAPPYVAWSRFFKRVGVPPAALGRINVGQPGFLHGFDALMAPAPLSTWQDYPRWHVVDTQTVACPQPTATPRSHSTKSPPVNRYARRALAHACV